MKYIFRKIALTFSLLALVVSCNEDDLTGQSTQTIASPALSVALDFPASQTFIEQEATYGFTATISEPQVVNVTVFLEASGTATEGDDFAIPHSVTIPIGATSVSDVITIHTDLEPEDTETLIVQIGTGNEPNVSAVSGQTATFTLQDFVFCTWKLETSDTFGDSWNGGYVEVITEGVTTQYAAEDAGSVFDILITDGADYSFSYVSGGGGFCGGPGYECENYFKLTAPDGTVWEEGSTDYSASPTEGLITSGTNACP